LNSLRPELKKKKKYQNKKKRKIKPFKPSRVKFRYFTTNFSPKTIQIDKR